MSPHVLAALLMALAILALIGAVIIAELRHHLACRRAKLRAIERLMPRAGLPTSHARRGA